MANSVTNRDCLDIWPEYGTSRKRTARTDVKMCHRALQCDPSGLEQKIHLGLVSHSKVNPFETMNRASELQEHRDELIDTDSVWLGNSGADLWQWIRAVRDAL